MPNLLTPAASNPKTARNAGGIEAAILHMAPHTVAGVGNVCPWATPGCAAACLNTAGRGQMSTVQAARVRKTREFFDNPRAFWHQLAAEIDTLDRRAKRRGHLGAIRLNGTSDIPWEKQKVGGMTLMEAFPDVWFYDYTKSISRAQAFATGDFPPNYHLTLSRGENMDEWATALMPPGVNVAVVFDALPETWAMRPVVDGTRDDWRFFDPVGVIVGLLPKGDAKRDTSGFVVRT